MQLGTRGITYEVPQYSLTGDIVSHHRCGLQYRYYNRSSLPPSRPVQLWTGEFVHGVMEEAYLLWQDGQSAFPWPCNPTQWPGNQKPAGRAGHDIGVLGDNVEARLRAGGKSARSTEARDAAYRRVEAAINVLAPNLFPLISAVEESVSGTRPMPNVGSPLGQTPRGDRYELVGRIDVISSVSLDEQKDNPLVEIVRGGVPNLSSDFDIILDYKAARRPAMVAATGMKSHWEHEALQVQMYSWLRSQRPGARPVRAGILIYVNELAPSQTDLGELRSEVSQRRTDIPPKPGSQDYYALFSGQSQQGASQFTSNFLLARAARIVPVDPQSLKQALNEIDDAVGAIERCVMNENQTGDIPSNWAATGDEQDCVACDFRRFCPNPSWMRGSGNKNLGVIRAPG